MKKSVSNKTVGKSKGVKAAPRKDVDKGRKEFYITTAIPYVNAAPHMGHALEFVQTDAVARSRKIMGRSVFLTTGADENSLKNVQAAEAKGITTQQLCDENAALFKRFAERIGLSFDAFMRSSSRTEHWPGVQELWKLCEKAGDIYKKKYTGLYCVGCEAFYKESELVEGYCPEHKKKPEHVEEENYFFRLSKYQKRLEELVESDKLLVIPKSRKDEVLAFIRGGLEDFSISRSKERAHGWGVPVPGDDKQIMYVWFDALSVYMTSVGWGTDKKKFGKWWPADVHVIGKGITRFHAVYWPAMLMSAKLPLPKVIFDHGYLTAEGQKMSKSLGNVVDPMAIMEKYGVDVLRFYLLNEIPTFDDGDFSEGRLIEKTNNELIGNFGNFAYRVLSFTKSNFGGSIPKPGKAGKEEKRLLDAMAKTKEAYIRHMKEYRLQDAMKEVLMLSAEGNRYFQLKKPWETMKTDKADCATAINFAANVVGALAVMMWPFLPSSCESLWKQLGFDGGIEARKIEGIDKPSMKDGHKIGEISPMYKKIEILEGLSMKTGKKTEMEKKVETKVVEAKPAMPAKETPVAPTTTFEKPFISFSEFQKLDLRVGKVESAEPVPGSSNLLRLIVDFGEKKLQAVSGIQKYYKPEQLVGNEYMFILNLERKKFMGVESQCMIFAAEDDGTPVALVPERKVKPGSFVH
jgi:methionyl-tRNA synthetase